MTITNLTLYAKLRINEANEKHAKHVRAAREWWAIAQATDDQSERRLYETLTAWMLAYSEADAAAGEAFTELETRLAKENA